MKIHASYGPGRSRSASVVALAAAGMLVVMLVAQLYAYEDMAHAVSALLPAGDTRSLYAGAALLVIAELLSLPYLLGMYLSRLMRYCSAATAFGVSGFWLFASFTNAHAENSGLFSSSAVVPGGILPAAWTAGLFFLVAATIAFDSRFRHVSPLR